LYALILAPVFYIDQSDAEEACRPITHRPQDCQWHMLLLCNLLAICLLDGFMLLMIPTLENAELLILCYTVVLK